MNAVYTVRGVQVYNIVNVYYDLLYLYIHEHVYLLAIDW